jgi:hypothetical protein
MSTDPNLGWDDARRMSAPIVAEANELAKRAKALGGVSRDEAITLIGWAQEYGLRYHEPMVHGGSGWASVVEHINIGPVRHIPILG